MQRDEGSLGSDRDVIDSLAYAGHEHIQYRLCCVPMVPTMMMTILLTARTCLLHFRIHLLSCLDPLILRALRAQSTIRPSHTRLARSVYVSVRVRGNNNQHTQVHTENHGHVCAQSERRMLRRAFSFSLSLCPLYARMLRHTRPCVRACAMQLAEGCRWS